MARLGEHLIAAGLIEPEKLDQALRAQVVWGGRLGTNLIELGAIDLDGLSRALGQQHGMPAALAKHFDRADPELQEMLPAALAKQLSVVPLVRLSAHRIAVVALDPLGPTALAALSAIYGVDPNDGIVTSVAAEMRVLYHLERVYKLSRPTRYLRSKGASITPFPTFDPESIDLDVEVEPEYVSELAPIANEVEVQVEAPVTQVDDSIPDVYDDRPTEQLQDIEALLDQAIENVTMPAAVTIQPVGRERRTYLRTLADQVEQAAAERGVEKADEVARDADTALRKSAAAAFDADTLTRKHRDADALRRLPTEDPPELDEVEILRPRRRESSARAALREALRDKPRTDPPADISISKRPTRDGVSVPKRPTRDNVSVPSRQTRDDVALRERPQSEPPPRARERPSDPVIPAARERPSDPVMPAARERPSDPVMPGAEARERPSDPAMPGSGPTSSTGALGRISIKRVAVQAGAVPVEKVAPPTNFLEATRAIKRGPNRDRVAELVCETLEQFVPSCDAALLLVIRGDVAIGWKHFSRKAARDPESNAEVAVPLNQPGIVPAVIARKARGRAAADDLGPIDTLLYQALGSDAGDLVVAPISIGTNVMCLLAVVATDANELEPIDAVAAAAGAAFIRLIRDASR